jgi:hypothetical protein
VEEVRDNSILGANQNREETTTPAGETSTVEHSDTAKRRLGFLRGQLTVPDDIKTMFADEIEEMFYGSLAERKFDDIDEAVG